MSFQQTLCGINPRKIFLFDSVGAILSAFLLGIVLVEYEHLFGMPRQTLYILASLACLFAIYDFICFWRLGENWKPFLKIIGIVNLLYCCLTITLVILNDELTGLGWTYFIVEMILIIAFAVWELKAASE